jgi:hypothetical protein
VRAAKIICSIGLAVWGYTEDLVPLLFILSVLTVSLLLSSIRWNVVGSALSVVGRGIMNTWGVVVVLWFCGSFICEVYNLLLLISGR